MTNNANFHSAGLNLGQNRDLPVEPGRDPNRSHRQIQRDADIAVKFERRGSSASLGGSQEVIVRNPSSTGWSSLSPDQSDASGGTSVRASISPLPPERLGNLWVPTTRPSADSGGGQEYAQHTVPKTQRAGQSAGSSAAQSGGGKSAIRFHHHPQVWESHKAEIEEIYMKENKSLKQLMDIMKDKRGFKATPRMYKSKFEQWGFVKNNKSKDVALMLRLQSQRDAAGKHTAFQRHGKMVDIHNYMRRKGVSSRDLVGLQDDADLPEYLRCLTPPPPAASPQHMTLPDHLHAQELLVSCFRDLTLGWRDSSAAASPASFEADFDAYFDGELCEATRDFSRACWFFSRGYTAHGALLSQRAFSALHLLVTRPSALGMFDLLIASVIEPDHGLSRELWKYLAAYAKAKLGAASTLYRLFRALKDVFRQGQDRDRGRDALGAGVDFVFACMESIIGMLLEHRDLTHTAAPALSFFLLGDLILFNSARTDLPALQRAIAASQDSIAADGTDRPPDVIRFLEPAAYLWQYGPHDDLSFGLAKAALHQQDPVSDRFDWTYWVAWRVIAEFHHGRCYNNDDADAGDTAVTTTTAEVVARSNPNPNPNPRHELARYSLERAIDAAEAGRGFGEVQVFENLQKLEDWHREAGDVARELAVRRRKEGALRAYLEMLQKSPRIEQPVTPR